MLGNIPIEGGREQESSLPPQCPQESALTPPSGRGTPSQPLHESPFPSHTPHTSATLPESGIISHPRHAPSPPQTPQASNSRPELGTPSHPLQDDESPPQTPHASAGGMIWNTELWAILEVSAEQGERALVNHLNSSSDISIPF
jgi:hypothetical protein